MNKCDICEVLFNDNTHSPYPDEMICEDCEAAIHSSVDDINVWEDFDPTPVDIPINYDDGLTDEEAEERYLPYMII